MNKQQLKHQPRVQKRNKQPAQLISSEFIAINENMQLIANFNTKKEMQDFAKKQPNLIWYNIKTFKLNNNTIQIKTKED